jgi:hypothetical protein
VSDAATQRIGRQPRPDLRSVTLHLHQQIAALAHHRWDTVIEIGGVGSGKSLGDAVVTLDRSRWDTSQWGCLAANTWPQLQAVTGEIYKWWEAAGEEHVFNCRPPREWIEEWRERGIITPPTRDRYTNVAITRSGLHIYQATLLNRNYKQLRAWEFGWIIIEEFTAGPTQAAVEFAMERVRCGIGPEQCSIRHRHTKYLKGNPPDDDGHWCYDWLAHLDAYAATLPGGEESKHADSYPNLLRGIGPVIYIPSRTSDNATNLGANYEANQLARLDEETAAKRLGGLMSRKRHGRTYHKFTSENEWPIEYHPDRGLSLYFDFNYNPAVAGAAHQLFPGEYPDQGETAKALRCDGIFGEFFHVGGMDAHQLGRALVAGERGSNGYFPANWRGLKGHTGKVTVYGDATAGAKKSMTGTNPWQIIRDVLRSELGGRVSFDVPDHNPLEQMRTRSVNARFCSAAGYRTLFIDPHCTQHIHDFGAVQTGSDGAILKPGGPRAGSKLYLLTHISDGLGYFVDRVSPLGREISQNAEDYIPRLGGTPRRPPRTSI